jgi:hypothetical protein
MKIIAYHGSNVEFDKFDQSKARIRNDLYGGGVAYFTNSLDMAKSYARVMSQKSGIPLVYEAALTINKLFDIDTLYRGNNLVQFLDMKEVETFARGAKLLAMGQNRIQTLANLRAGDMVLSGDQIFKGLSHGMNQTAKARMKLAKMGFDALRYNAQGNSVYLMYNAHQIKIDNRYIVRTNTDTKTNESYKFI